MSLIAVGTAAAAAADAILATRLTVTDQIVTAHETDWDGGVERRGAIVIDRFCQALGGRVAA